MRDHELLAIKRYLQFLRYLDDPVARSLSDAPIDDEDTTEEEIAAFRETDADFRIGDVATQEELEKEFGVLTRTAVYSRQAERDVRGLERSTVQRDTHLAGASPHR